PVRTPGKGVKDGLFARWLYLEHHTASRIERACAHGYVAAAVGGAVEVARLVTNQTGGRIGSVRSSRKAVKDGLFAALIDLEYSSAAGAVACVEVARPVANDVPQGELPVPAGKRVEHGIAWRVLRFLLVFFLCGNCRQRQQA